METCKWIRLMSILDRCWWIYEDYIDTSFKTCNSVFPCSSDQGWNFFTFSGNWNWQVLLSGFSTRKKLGLTSWPRPMCGGSCWPAPWASVQLFTFRFNFGRLYYMVIVQESGVWPICGGSCWPALWASVVQLQGGGRLPTTPRPQISPGGGAALDLVRFSILCCICAETLVRLLN